MLPIRSHPATLQFHFHSTAAMLENEGHFSALKIVLEVLPLVVAVVVVCCVLFFMICSTKWLIAGKKHIGLQLKLQKSCQFTDFPVILNWTLVPRCGGLSVFKSFRFQSD